MIKSSMDYVPEIIAQLSYVTCGIAFGYLFYIPFFIPNRGDQYYWPFITGILVAVIICGIGSVIIKHIKRKEIFVHFYAIAIGQICFLITGCLFYTNADEYYPSPTGMYLIGIGHALTYIFGFSYVNLRSLTFRTSRISLCHYFYFLGFLFAVLELSNATINVINAVNIGLWMIICCSVLIALLILNEILHAHNVYNYKESINTELNVANNNEELMLNRDQLVEVLKSKNQSGWNFSVGKSYQNMYQFWAPLLKLKGFLLFSYMILVYYGILQTAIFTADPNLIFIPQLFIVVGSILGVLATLLISTKWIFLICNSAQIIALFVAIMLNLNMDGVNEIIALWIYFGLCAVSYGIADISILEITHLKYTELMLSIGYLIEIVPITVFQYYVLYDFGAVWITDETINFMAHCCILIGISVVLMVISMLIIRITFFKKTLLQIKYDLLGIRYFQTFDAINVNNMTNIQPSAPMIMESHSQEPNKNFETYAPTYQLPRVHLS